MPATNLAESCPLTATSDNEAFVGTWKKSDGNMTLTIWKDPENEDGFKGQFRGGNIFDIHGCCCIA